MENIFVINPSISPLDINDTIVRKLEHAQAIADGFSALEFDGDKQLLSGAFGVISDLLSEVKILSDVLFKKIEPNY